MATPSQRSVHSAPDMHRRGTPCERSLPLPRVRQRVSGYSNLLTKSLRAMRTKRKVAFGPNLERARCLTCGLFRCSVQLCSGLVDLVVCKVHYLGGADRLALACERFVGRLPEDLVEVS